MEHLFQTFDSLSIAMGTANLTTPLIKISEKWG